MNGKDFAIGVLTVTAVVLLTAVLLLNALAPKSAEAFAQLDRAGNYLMFTAQVSNSREMLYVIDQQAGLMNAYAFDINRGVLRPLQQLPIVPASR